MPSRTFAFSTNAYSRHPLEHALRRIAEIGFPAVEILGDKPHAWCDGLTDQQIGRIAEQVARLGLKVSNINANCTFGYYSDAPPEPFFEPSVISRNPESRAWRIAYTKRALDLAAAVGSPACCITSGKCLNGVPPELARTYLIEALQELLDYAARVGAKLALEYEPALYIERTQELVDLIAELGDPSLGANLDIGHVVVAGEDPVWAVNALQGHIHGLHFEDIRDAKHYHRVPGEGDMDFRAVTDALAAGGYDGFITWELYTADEDPDAACEATWRYCCRHWPD
jgi:sugar phosphate isomerase/epimerase